MTLYTILPLLFAFIISAAVYIDAAKRYDTKKMRVFWGLGVFLVMIVFLPAYLIVRPPRKHGPEGDTVES